MNIRQPTLPMGWYPRDKDKIEEFLGPFLKNAAANGLDNRSRAAIAPHAGWYYSGSLAALAISSLDSSAETVVVIGGHLPGKIPILIAEEDGAKTPLGIMEIDSDLRREFEKQLLKNKLFYQSDRYNDNTVEVLLPMVHAFFPRSQLLWLRFPAEISSYHAGKILYDTAQVLGRRIVAIASVDLTHYGDNYGFAPKGRGKAALDWVKSVNDALLIEAVLSGDPDLVLKRAEMDKSTCSAGAVLGVMGFSNFAINKGNKAKLMEYRTSADVNGDVVPDSFVGYAAISF